MTKNYTGVEIEAVVKSATSFAFLELRIFLILQNQLL